MRGVRGEVTAPKDPANAPVWSEIREHVDEPGFEGRYAGIADAERDSFHKHPWSIGGGGAAELKDRFDDAGELRLGALVADHGVFGISGADDVMLATASVFRRKRVSDRYFRPLVAGASVRDWGVEPSETILFPYDHELLPLGGNQGFDQWLWRVRTNLGARATFNQSTYAAEGRPWWAWHQVTLDRARVPMSVTLAEIATHNHFALDRGSGVFGRTAPIIKLPETATPADHLEVLGILNSSSAGFWLRQVCFPKRGDGIGRGIATEPWEFRFEFDGAKVSQLPLPANRPHNLAAVIQGTTQN